MPKSIHRQEHQVLAGMLRALREEAGLTQADLAPKLGRPQNRVSDFERGGRRVDVIEFIDYCDALGKDPVAVFRALRQRILAFEEKRASSTAGGRAKKLPRG